MSVRIDEAEDKLPTPESPYYDRDVRIPGIGAPPNRCRGLTPSGFCESGHVILGRSSCDTRYCPDHWRGWVRDGTVSAVERLAAFREAAEGWGKRLLHVVASPTDDRVSADRFWKLRTKAQDVVKQCGVRGGYSVAHPFRTSDAADRLFEAACEHGEWEKEWGRWSFLRDYVSHLSGEDGRWDKWEPLVEAGPHYHFIGACEDFNPDAVPDGWVVKNIRSFSRFEKRDMECYEDMAKAVYYLRTHGGAAEHRQTATWFGEVHPSVFDPEEELTAAGWMRIQENAAASVGLELEETGDGEKPRCEIDGCEAVVHQLEELRGYLADSSWMVSLDPDQRFRLRAVEVWVFEQSVTPPPHVRNDESKVRDWLLETGRMYFSGSRQTGLKAFD